MPGEEATDTDAHTIDVTMTADETGGTIGNGLAGLEGENDDEAWSQPKEPYVGMRFDTAEGAKEHYNACICFATWVFCQEEHFKEVC